MNFLSEGLNRDPRDPTCGLGVGALSQEEDRDQGSGVQGAKFTPASLTSSLPGCLSSLQGQTALALFRCQNT